MSTERVDVLAVMDALANGYLCNEGTKNAFVACSTETKPGDGTKVGDAWGSLREARAAVAELIEVARRIERDATPLEWSNGQLSYEIAEADIADIRAALARVQGGAA